MIREHSSVSRLSLSAYFGMLVFGCVMALLGAVLAPLRRTLGFNETGIGTLYLLMNGMMLVSSLAAGFVMSHRGARLPLALGPAATGVALALMARATSFGDLEAAVLVLGVGGGLLNASANHLVASLHTEPERKGSALNFLGIFFGFGALLLPFFIGSLLEWPGIPVVLMVTAGLCLGAAGYAAVLRYPEPEAAPAGRLADDLRHPLVAALGLLLFFHSGAEFTLTGFATTHLTKTAGLDVQKATWTLAGYWAALMLARVLLSRYISRMRHHHVLAGCGALATVGSLVVARAETAPVAVAGLLLTAFAYSGLFPTTLAVAGAHNPARAGILTGVLIMLAMAGGMLLPFAAGHLAAKAGVASVFYLTAGAFAAIAGLGLLAGRLGE